MFSSVLQLIVCREVAGSNPVTPILFFMSRDVNDKLKNNIKGGMLYVT